LSRTVLRSAQHPACRLFAALFALLLPAAAAFANEPPPTFADRNVAILQGLDKITARVWTFDAPLGQAVRFGTLEIVAEACRERPPEEPPESAAFLRIVDHRHDGVPEELFRGWMFASSPALSALEHPVYDVWVIGCRSDR